MSLSNYPPGHPTGVAHGEETQVFECEPCNSLITPEDLGALKLKLQLRHGHTATCPNCNQPIQPATCTRCDQPATHIGVDEAVNAAEPFCSSHGMR